MVKFFEAMVAAGASDLHLKAGMPPRSRTRTLLQEAKSPPVSPEELQHLVADLLDDRQLEVFHTTGSIDLAYELEGSDRFRLNIYHQRGSVAVAVRRVTREIPDFRALHLPPVIERIAENRQGLILISGGTGTGKSTTIASMLEYINQTRACHIVTIEDPIEYLYEDKKAMVSQREVGIDVADFEDGLKYLMRQDPDVVLIGEMRDTDTFRAALQAAETGHLVLGTLHASSAFQTIGRIMDLFPPGARDRVRLSLAFNLRAIVCQKLLPAIAAGIDRIPAVEVLLAGPDVRKLIEDGRDGDLSDAIRSHEREGMQSFTTSLLELIDNEYVDPKVACEAAPNADELKMLMKGISASRAGLMGR